MPLLRDNFQLACSSCTGLTYVPFTEKQIKLVETFADQAVIAIENTRLLNELRDRTADLSKSLEQQTAASEVLQVISSARGDLQPVFEAILENAVRICDAMGGGICRWDGDALYHVALKWARPAFTDFLMRTPIHPNPKTNFGLMLATKTVVHVPDLLPTQLILNNASREIVTAVEVGHIRTALYVPMLKENELIGASPSGHEEVRPFTEKQIALVQNFADQAVIAIENARLLGELRQRTDDLTRDSLEQQTATSEVLRIISSSPGELEPVFETMLRTLSKSAEHSLATCSCVRAISFMLEQQLETHRPHTSIICAVSVR